MFRRPLSLLPRTVNVLCSRAGSTPSARPLPPPSPIDNIPETVYHRWILEEHMPVAYRSIHIHSRSTYLFAMAVSALMWTWILTGLWYESDHLLGHYEWPDAKSWTDKELGIPNEIEIEMEEEDEG
ncbi:NADH dehydrogenase [ubiquinone] 1 beta subcomplex subunit 2, mitochondrial-like [Watersipora subatra]|uniref:NADH dehydrogenase [ubiquinone] 1 beta subcomplex subunit 2, mitochondrial-like n=1 Tax=Watersipora subatra TaxID=2589382 RepID=UPI00355B0968